MKTLIAIILVPLIVLAIESINPHTVCDRFAGVSDQKACQARVQALKSDSYLTSICQKQFDDDAFWSCMELSKNSSFDPSKLDACANNDINDQERLSCLKGVASNSKGTEFQSAGKTTTRKEANSRQAESQ